MSTRDFASPTSNAMSGLGPGALGLIVWLALFFALVAWKHAALWYPPYNEYAETIWTEAAFLHESNFDYPQLVLGEAQIEEGGVRSYSISVVPSIIAGLVRLVGPERADLIYHLVVLACGAAMMAWTLLTLQRHLGLVPALLTSLVVFTTPVFSTQLEMMGIDLPMGASVVLAAHALKERALVAAALATMAAFLVKPSSAPATLCLAIVVFLMLTLRVGRIRGHGKRGWLALGLVIAVGLVQFVMLRFAARDAQTAHRDLFMGPIISMLLWLFLCPYYFLLLPYVFFVQYRYFFWSRRNRSRPDRARRSWLGRARAMLRVGLRRQPEMVFAWFYAGIVLVSCLFFMFATRYLISISPFFALVIGDTWFRRARSRRLATFIVGLLLVNNAANAFGKFLIPLPPELMRNWCVPERSLEYRSDLESTIQGARFLREANLGEPIVAGKLFTQILASPLLGYADAPIAGYTVLDDFPLGKLRHLAHILDDKPASLIVVSVTTQEYRFPPPGPEDEILFTDDLYPPLVIYRKRFAAEPGGTEHEDWLRALIKENVSPYIRCSMLLTSGNAPIGEEYLRRRFEQSPLDPELKGRLAKLFDDLGDPVTARCLRDSVDRAKAPDRDNQTVDYQ